MISKYGIKLKPRSAPVKPLPMDLQGEAGERIVKAAAKRVIIQHRKVIKALANR